MYNFDTKYINKYIRLKIHNPQIIPTKEIFKTEKFLNDNSNISESEFKPPNTRNAIAVNIATKDINSLFSLCPSSFIEFSISSRSSQNAHKIYLD